MDDIKLGLKENWQQFTLLIIINAFVGGMVGIERSILPEIAEKDFDMAVKTANEYGLRPYPFYLGVVFAFLGLSGSWFFVQDTVHHVAKETTTSVNTGGDTGQIYLKKKWLF